MHLRLTFLGQAGFLIETKGSRILIDPYLSNSVAARFGVSFDRLVANPLSDSDLKEIDWVLLTHAHLDHTDPESLQRIVHFSPKACYLAPYESCAILKDLNIPQQQVLQANKKEWIDLTLEIRVCIIPAAHPHLEWNKEGEWRYVGYLLQIGEVALYHAGDTIPHPAIYDAVEKAQVNQIDYAFLPINERNYYREQANIIGNMSLREGFQLAQDLHVKTLVPIHWDLFCFNSVYPEEIELLYRLENPSFQLQIMPVGKIHEIA